MNKTLIIKQPAGLGDIIFCQKIAYIFNERGFDNILWKVIPQYEWIKDYLISPAKFVTSIGEYEGYLNGTVPVNKEDLMYLPLQHADFIYKDKKIMESKYQMVNIDYSDWRDYFKFSRNHDKENDLFYNKLGLNDEEKYTLVSRNYGSPPNFLKYPMNIVEDIKIVELEFIEGYSLFDWCKVIEKAKEIHMIDSSVNFLLEVLNIETNKLYLYTRRKNNFSEIDYLFERKYILKYD